ncbi:MAG TPA: hypothetical protein VLG08_00535 [Casimicrobiaceae bacterium]|jgi:hypothetical protein|nr:hypothetical protein [Casimicrobiaceae bacterium]
MPRPDAHPPSTVGVYDRPHPLRTRKVIVPVAVFVVVALAYALYFIMR